MLEMAKLVWPVDVDGLAARAYVEILRRR